MKEYGLIGYPLLHSFSKKYFTEKFMKEGLSDHSFELFPINDIYELTAILNDHPNLKGFAVTIPHKQNVIPFLNDVDDAVKSIGAVNCVHIIDGKLKGYNTDVTGFERSFSPLLKPNHKKALVLGTGGASKAVQYILKKIGLPFLLVSRQNKGVSHISYDEIDEALINEYTVIINASPVGMLPNEHEAPYIPYEFLNENNYLYDLVYKPVETLFLAKGAARGALVKNGFEMLIIQAEENWRIWNS